MTKAELVDELFEMASRGLVEVRDTDSARKLEPQFRPGDRLFVRTVSNGIMSWRVREFSRVR